MPATKVSACGYTVRVDTGDGSGFVTQALVDSIDPWDRAKSQIDTPVMDCDGSAEVGREQPSTLQIEQYLDGQDAEQALIDTNYEESKTDHTKKNVTVQLVSPSYLTGGATAGSEAVVTEEATCQIQEIGRPTMQPDGHNKRTVTFLRTSAITKTVA